MKGELFIFCNLKINTVIIVIIDIIFFATFSNDYDNETPEIGTRTAIVSPKFCKEGFHLHNGEICKEIKTRETATTQKESQLEIMKRIRARLRRRKE